MSILVRAIAVGAAFAFAVVSGTTATAASADAGILAWSDCPSGRVCLFDGVNGATMIIPVLPACSDYNYGSANNDRANSVRNRTLYTAYLYDYVGGGAWTLLETVAPNSQENLTASERNRVDRVRVAGC